MNFKNNILNIFNESYKLKLNEFYDWIWLEIN